MSIKSVFKSIINTLKKILRIFKIFKNKLILVLLLIITLSFFCIEYSKDILNKISKDNKNNTILIELNKKIENIDYNNKELKNYITELENKINNYNNKILNYENKIIDLENRIIKLENTNPINNERNIQIIILINKIKDLYYSNNNFVNELESLKILSKNKPDIYNNILKLDNFLNKKSSFEDFKEEYKKLLTKQDKKNIIKDFINENIQIRKINPKENDNINKNIKDIENYINLHQYKKALDIIKENNYNNIFIKTINTLNNNIEFDNIINGVVDGMYGGY